MLDLAMMAIILGVTTILLVLLLLQVGARGIAPIEIVWLLGFFVLRNFWFALFEIGGRGATPGKRILGLRVVARDGARLTGGAVIARNAMREIEIFLPLSFLAVQTANGAADAFLALFALTWSGIFLLFPFFNRDRLRIGDLLAGTWVVHTVRGQLAGDLVADPGTGQRRVFSEAALNLYGVYELQMLEDVLRRGQEDALTTVAATIRHKAGLPYDSDAHGFLSDYYAALCARLERNVMLGQRRDDKHAPATRRI